MNAPQSRNNPGLRILHLEDNPTDAALLEASLQLQLPCQLTVVTNRRTFEAALEQELPDLIISDSSLPNFDGAFGAGAGAEKIPANSVHLLLRQILRIQTGGSPFLGGVGFYPKDDVTALIDLIKRLCGDQPADK